MADARQKVIDYLKENGKTSKQRTATIGIDAFIDKIVRVVNSKSDKNEYVFFNDIAQFGKHIVSKSGMSCGIEVSERFSKLGGNAPIMCNSLASLSVNVNCVAAVGYPDVDPIFKDLENICNVFTIGNPGYTTALEFNDGKIMLSQRDHLHKIDWHTVKVILGLDKIKEFFSTSNLTALVNWNGMINFNEIFRGILEEVIIDKTPNKDKIIFFDMADFSERSRTDICEAVELIKEFNSFYKVILGLNENEALLMYKALFPEKELLELKSLGQYLYDNIKVDSLVIHTLTSSLAWDGQSVAEVPSLYVRDPKLSTGGGDNFNAGLCFGQLMGLDFEGSLYTANATSGYYVRNAKSPSIDDLVETLERWEELIETPI